MFNVPYSPYPTSAYTNPYIQPVRQEIIRVSGEAGAKAYNMAPNSQALLLDEYDPIVWLKTTDGAGYPTITPYKIAPYTPETSMDIKALEDRIAKLEARYESDNKSAGAKK